MPKNAGNNDGLEGFNQWAIERFGVEHANMDPNSPNKYFDTQLSDLYTYLDMQIIAQWVLPRLAPSRRTRAWILDVGAGKGRMTRRFVEIAEHCVAIEPFPGFYDVLEEQCHSSKLRTYKSTLLSYAKVATERFDVIYLSGVLPYLNHSELHDSLNVLHNLLRSGGLICIRDFGTEGKVARSASQIVEIAKKTGLIMRKPEEIRSVAEKTGFVCLRWRRAYPPNVPWIVYNRWPNRLTELSWHIASSPSFFSVWSLLAKLNLPHKENCYFFYLLQQKEFD
jgi:SAM-dependent methyltransferase